MHADAQLSTVMPGMYPELPTRARPPEGPPFKDGSMTHPIALNPLACGATVATIFDDVCAVVVVGIRVVVVDDVCAVVVIGTTVAVVVDDVCAMVVEELPLPALLLLD